MMEMDKVWEKNENVDVPCFWWMMCWRSPFHSFLYPFCTPSSLSKHVVGNIIHINIHISYIFSCFAHSYTCSSLSYLLILPFFYSEGSFVSPIFSQQEDKELLKLTLHFSASSCCCFQPSLYLFNFSSRFSHLRYLLSSSSLSTWKLHSSSPSFLGSKTFGIKMKEQSDRV